jgi:hypothetical protein
VLGMRPPSASDAAAKLCSGFPGPGGGVYLNQPVSTELSPNTKTLSNVTRDADAGIELASVANAVKPERSNAALGRIERPSVFIKNPRQ